MSECVERNDHGNEFQGISTVIITDGIGLWERGSARDVLELGSCVHVCVPLCAQEKIVFITTE
jgi:hypothetical protein